MYTLKHTLPHATMEKQGNKQLLHGSKEKVKHAVKHIKKMKLGQE